MKKFRDHRQFWRRVAAVCCFNSAWTEPGTRQSPARLLRTGPCHLFTAPWDRPPRPPPLLPHNHRCHHLSSAASQDDLVLLAGVPELPPGLGSGHQPPDQPGALCLLRLPVHGKRRLGRRGAGVWLAGGASRLPPLRGSGKWRLLRVPQDFAEIPRSRPFPTDPWECPFVGRLPLPAHPPPPFFSLPRLLPVPSCS